MKDPIQIYAYSKDGNAYKFSSMAAAAQFTGDSPPTVAQRVNKRVEKITPKGFIYTRKPLTQSELDELFDKDDSKLQRANDICKEKENGFEYEVDCRNRMVCWLPRSREGKLEMLKKFINERLKLHWMTCSKQQAALEHKFLKEVFDNL